MEIILVPERCQDFILEYDDFCIKHFRLSANTIYIACVSADVMPDKIAGGLKEIFVRRDLHKGTIKPDNIKSQMDLLYERFGVVAIEDVTPFQWQAFFNMLSEDNAKVLKNIIMGWDGYLE